MFEHIDAELQRKKRSFPQRKLLRMSDEQMVKMNTICKERGITMSFFLRAILDMALEEIEKEQDS